MDLHNLNIRLIEHKNFLWTCTTLNDPYDIYEEIGSARMASGIAHNCALVMAEDIWLKWISLPWVKANLTATSNAEYLARGVMGIWHAAHETDDVVVLTDTNVHHADRIIMNMSYTFVHISQVKYPQQFDAPVRKV